MRPYGYTVDRKATIADEALVIGDAIARVLGGESLRSIARSLNDQGIKTYNGFLWRSQGLKRILLQPLNVETGLVSEADHDKLKEILTDPSRRQSHRYELAHVLTGGYVRCGLCANAMVYRGTSYACPVAPAGCGRVRIGAPALEAYIRDLVFSLLTTPQTRAGLRRAESRAKTADKALKAANGRLTQAAVDYAKGDISRPAWLALSREHQRLTAAANRERRRLAATGHLPKPLTPKTLAAWWDKASTTTKRELLGLVLDHVKIKPAPDRRRPHDGSVDARRLKVIWLKLEENP